MVSAWSLTVSTSCLSDCQPIIAANARRRENMIKAREEAPENKAANSFSVGPPWALVYSGVGSGLALTTSSVAGAALALEIDLESSWLIWSAEANTKKISPQRQNAITSQSFTFCIGVFLAILFVPLCRSTSISRVLADDDHGKVVPLIRREHLPESRITDEERCRGGAGRFEKRRA
jgi:hypothetical protein